MTDENYMPINWQNHNRHLTQEELIEIKRRLSGLHFSQDAFIDNPIAMQGLYIGEALLREILLRDGLDT